MELLTVGEMARRSGVPATTLRYYDSVGLLHPVRLANSHRRYLVEDLERLRYIRLCRSLGCDLDEIRVLVEPGASEERRMAAKRELDRVERQQRRLAAAAAVLSHFAECTCQDTAECRAIIRVALDGELGEPEDGRRALTGRTR